MPILKGLRLGATTGAAFTPGSVLLGVGGTAAEFPNLPMTSIVGSGLLYGSIGLGLGVLVGGTWGALAHNGVNRGSHDEYLRATSKWMGVGTLVATLPGVLIGGPIGYDGASVGSVLVGAAIGGGLLGGGGSVLGATLGCLSRAIDPNR